MIMSIRTLTFTLIRVFHLYYFRKCRNGNHQTIETKERTMATVKLTFPNEDTYETWEKSIEYCRYDSRGYQCVYLNTDDDGTLKAIAKASELGASQESYR